MQLMQFNIKRQESNKSLLVQNVREEQSCGIFPICNVQSTTEKRREHMKGNHTHT